MGLEIEHKYLVKDDSYLEYTMRSFRISQGYLSRDPERTVRVRVKGDRGYFAIKGKNEGAVRKEFEYEIPLADANQLLEMCQPPVIEKTRHIVEYGGKIWEIDSFSGSREGLVTAEIELSSAEETYDLPPFVGEDVTGNAAYYNSNL